MKNLILTVFIVIAVLSCSCESTEPIDLRQLSIRVEDVSCTEAWITINSSNIDLPTNLNLAANTNLKKQLTLTTQDTIIVIDSLNPGTNYSLQALTGDLSSEKVNAVTMDTTSHDFIWQTFTFGGDDGSSYLKDVAIISENNIWAVGEIYENGEKYNAVHWNGSEWELKKILVNFHGNTIFLPLEGIHTFTESDIWLVGSLPIHGNGENWTIYDVREITNSNLSLSSAWGSSSEDMYFVGRSGSIVHYDGRSSGVRWTKIESGTELDIYDIWGDYNERIGEYEILAVAAKLLHSSDRDILRITPDGIEKIDETGIEWSLHGIWFRSNKKYFVVGSGIYKKQSLIEANWDTKLDILTNYYTHSIRGIDFNDILIAGAYNEVLHYNGYSWKSYRGLINNSTTGRLVKIAYKNKTCSIVGSNNSKAIICIGERE